MGKHHGSSSSSSSSSRPKQESKVLFPGTLPLASAGVGGYWLLATGWVLLSYSLTRSPLRSRGRRIIIHEPAPSDHPVFVERQYRVLNAAQCSLTTVFPKYPNSLLVNIVSVYCLLQCPQFWLVHVLKMFSSRLHIVWFPVSMVHTPRNKPCVGSFIGTFFTPHGKCQTC